ncbi:TonB-dependent receptor domain-containing protein [Nitrosovibrio sp. Nv4]|uniref:TonB-dependent receptor domain-containing protein n=1 Tax=Nitrosovibrio sp. Nv4 TaxID=1945880 RepID=UPI000BDC7B92|nr:TonB-dependent receptor [Nitrosovibrio sp. Nv4]SOD42524.1 FecR family protein [Nitrosovibrio sp. Nv4]
MKSYWNSCQKSERFWSAGVAVLWATVVALLNSALDVHAAELCTPAIAMMVSVQGAVELRRVRETDWQPAKLNAALCPGDTVRVRERSRAALRLSNESTLRLDQKTVLTLAASGQDRTALVELLTGSLYVITRTPKPFRVRTPVLVANVEGTEFFIGTDQDSARLVIYEGKVSASNEQGSISLVSNEAATIARDQPPRKEEVVRPTDAVQWALYYPTIIGYRLDEKLADEPAAPMLSTSIDLYRQGRLPEALAALDGVPQGERSPRFLTYRAGLLLSVGRVEQARADIEQALKLEPGNSDAYALQAIIAVVQNDKEQALALATKAVELDEASSTARLALSYAQQAHFQIEAALESAQKATEFDPQNALIWARLAELHMSTGYLDRALEAAQRAVDLNPNLSKTQTVLGFAHLTQIDTGAAKSAFTKAIELDQADPMPRLGMGLAKIREGDLEAGRIELEIATSLDPLNSLIRSYLGKAYFEEKRYNLAEAQFDLAKALDPNDPTPWFYDAIQKQTQNRPVEALWDLQKSIKLNDNRAVYRSKLLLDRDQAARGSSLARIYDNLGFEKRALMETAKSLSLDPASHSSHRFLSDAYADIPRHDIARVSELLQAQLLQPINVNPVQPRLAVADLNVITTTGPAVAGFNEFAPLVERNKPQLVASGIFGSNNTIGDEAVLTALYGRASVSVGQFHYNTDGFRPNNDQKHNVYNAFIQYAVTPRFNVQAEVRTRETEHGDLLQDFDLDTFSEQSRRKLQQDWVRIGARYSLSPKQDFIVSGIYTDRKEDLLSPVAPTITFGSPFVTDGRRDRGYQAEVQYLLREDRFNVTAGGGTYRFDVEREQNLDFGNPPCFPGVICNLIRPDVGSKRDNAYIYTNLNLPKNINATLGLSYDSFKYDIDREDFRRLGIPIGAGDDKSFSFHKVSPKIGLQWNITDDLRLRLAWFETIKPALVANQTLEPTQVAGFNQMFDDVNGTRARRMGLGLDARIANKLYGGFEVSARDLDVPLLREYLSLRRIVKQKEKLYRTYLYWLPHPYWAIRGELRFEKFSQHPDSAGSNPYRMETLSVPVSLNYFDPSGVFAKLTTSYVRQEVARLASTNAGVDGFVLLDTAIGYRLPKRRGILSLEGRNLLNEDFFYRNINLQQSEQQFYNLRYSPDRTFFLRLTLNF